MKKWIAASIAIAALLVTVVGGCGAKMPTVAEGSQNDAYESKLEINTDYVNQDYVILPAD